VRVDPLGQRKGDLRVTDGVPEALLGTEFVHPAPVHLDRLNAQDRPSHRLQAMPYPQRLGNRSEDLGSRV